MSATMKSTVVTTAEPVHMAGSPSKKRVGTWGALRAPIGDDQRRSARSYDVHGLAAGRARRRKLGIPLRAAIGDARASVLAPVEHADGLAEVERRLLRDDALLPPAVRNHGAGHRQDTADHELHRQICAYQRRDAAADEGDADRQQ